MKDGVEFFDSILPGMVYCLFLVFLNEQFIKTETGESFEIILFCMVVILVARFILQAILDRSKRKNLRGNHGN